MEICRFAKYLAMEEAHFVDRFAIETAAPHAHTVDAVAEAAIGIRQERGRVARHQGRPANHGVLTDATELLNHRGSSEDRTVTDGDMTGQQHTAGHDDVIFNHTIVRNVRVGHEHAIVTDLGDGTFGRSPVNGHAFANDGPIADATKTFGPVVTEILWGSANAGERMNHAPAPDVCVSLDVRVGANPRALTDAHRSINDGVRSDLNAIFQGGLFVDYGAGMNHGDALTGVIDMLSEPSARLQRRRIGFRSTKSNLRRG